MRLFAILAAVLIATPCLASAQSVLERVLGQIDNSTNLGQVNGTYANIAENVGVASSTTTELVPADISNAPGSAALWHLDLAAITVDDIGTTFTAGDGTAVGTTLQAMGGTSIIVNADGSLTVDPGTGTLYFRDPEDFFEFITVTSPTALNLPDVYYAYEISPGNFVFSTPETVVNTFGAGMDDTLVMAEVVSTIPGFSPDIDASITNIISGVGDATAEAVAGAATATEFILPTIDLGDMATTALGAVNTGEIMLGVNSAVDEAETTYTNAISAALQQVGTALSGAVVINVASNMSAVDGSINNVIAEVNGTIGNLSTTALGAVNTGTIVSGVDAAVQGIVGMSGQTGL